MTSLIAIVVPQCFELYFITINRKQVLDISLYFDILIISSLVYKRDLCKFKGRGVLWCSWAPRSAVRKCRGHGRLPHAAGHGAGGTGRWASSTPQAQPGPVRLLRCTAARQKSYQTEGHHRNSDRYIKIVLMKSDVVEYSAIGTSPDPSKLNDQQSFPAGLRFLLHLLAHACVCHIIQMCNQ